MTRLASQPAISQWIAQLESMIPESRNERVHPIAPTFYPIKRMLQDMAVEMPGYAQHEVGAGFVDRDIAQKYFADFRFSNFIKVFAQEGGDYTAFP